MNPNLKVSIFQFDISWLNLKKNINFIQNHLESLNEKADLVVLPEMFLSGFCMDAHQSAVREEGPEISQLVDVSKKYNLALIGSLAIAEDGKFFNRAVLIDENGIVGRYDKRRLYSPSGENETFSTKYRLEPMTCKGWKILPQVCYDLRFPENVRSLPPPDILIYMANWPSPRIHHWDALLKARAIENQCFTIGCNRLGTDGNGWEFPGHSIIIKPDGTPVNTADNINSRAVPLSHEMLISYRKKYRFLEDK